MSKAFIKMIIAYVILLVVFATVFTFLIHVIFSNPEGIGSWFGKLVSGFKNSN